MSETGWKNKFKQEKLKKIFFSFAWNCVKKGFWWDFIFYETKFLLFFVQKKICYVFLFS